MEIERCSIFDIQDIDDMIDNSFNGTCFAYSWFLKLKNSKDILKIMYKNKFIGFMPLFAFDDVDVINQSTMYIPYGGPVLFDVPKEERNKIRFIRNIEKTLVKYFEKNFREVNFSTDNEIIDIMPFIRSNFVPELRYTYKIDLRKSMNEIYSEFGSDRKKDLRKSKKRNLQFVIDDKCEIFDSNKAMKWEKKYNFDSTSDFTERYIKETINHKRGMCFIAKENDKVIGGVHIAWDSKCAYILYSYYEENNDDIAIAFLYYKIFEYLKENQIVSFIDFEGSVFESIEDWNISFGAYQSRFYNLHWSKENKDFSNIYDYGEK